MNRNVVLILSACLCTALGCSSGDPLLEQVGDRTQADFVNGGFETGTLTSWTVDTSKKVPSGGIPTFPPLTVADLGLVAGTSTNATQVEMGALPESMTADGLTAADSLKYPRVGLYSTVVNSLGKNNNSNGLSQTMTTTATDVDTDGNIHIRFLFAPVLQNPGHAANQQPYFFFEVKNNTKSTTLFTGFNYSAQPGVPYQTSGGGTIQYTGWQLFDIAPGAGKLDVGDMVTVNIIASGCALGGHWGHVYVDAVGTKIPALLVAGSAASTVVAGNNLTYTFTINNNTGGSASGVTFADSLPTGTTFVSITPPTGVTCTVPAVGVNGQVSCPIGTMASGATTTVAITVKVAANSPTPVSNGSYTIQATGISQLIGPLVTTKVLYPVTVQVPGGNGTITCSDPSGGSSTCTIAPAAGYSLASLALDGTSVIGSVSGNTYVVSDTSVPHTLQGTFSLTTYTVSASVPGGNGTLTCNSPVFAGSTATCTITPSTGFVLSALTDNGGNVLGSVMGNSYTIANVMANHTVQAAFAPAMEAVTGSSAGNGTVMCTSPVTYNTTSTCTITPAAGYVLATLTDNGSSVIGMVTGGNTYTLNNVTAAHSVQATFAKAQYTVVANIPGGNGTITCTSPVSSGQTSVCQISPSTGYMLTALTDNGTDVMSSISGTSYQIPSVTANHTLQGTFSAISLSVTSQVPGGHGTITCTNPVAYGGSSTCTITPATGYMLGTLTLDGTDVMGSVSGNTLTINSVTTSHLVQGTFVPTMFPITIDNPGGNGTVNCNNPVTYGQTAICQIVPAAGYRLQSLAVDTTDITNQVNGNSFTIPNVTGPHTVHVAFEPVPQYTVTVQVPGGHGTITCSGPVVEGQNVTCTITPDAGYELDTLTLDGMDARILVQGGQLTLYNVIASHTLQGGFKASIASGCSSASDCHSGFCVDGVCCNTSCDDACEACAEAGSVGTCTPVTGQPRPSHPSCGSYMCGPVNGQPGDPIGCMNGCNSDSDCSNGTVCSQRTCVSGSHTLSGGGIAGCSTTDHGGSAGATSGGLALLLLLAVSRRRLRGNPVRA